MRRATRAVRCGTVMIGGDHPVSIQSMTNTNTSDTDSTIEQIRALVAAGCQIVRVAIPDRDAALALDKIKGAVSVPI
ncbi:MAG: flavodoxin-dependent (E)-4-hydroxy-3-methylbut-2-enyl-diphosphate synthase, partial [Eubacteriales bacterium]|nr:flavodoxin-dependent (E)-4-hydroxy-3-methylbut-2-enyl-diphosphate synthase [Eubacteriales bacterium]